MSRSQQKQQGDDGAQMVIRDSYSYFEQYSMITNKIYMLYT